jgi:hypothetical protein
MYLSAVNNILSEIMPKQEQKQSGTGICHVMHGMKNDNGGTANGSVSLGCLLIKAQQMAIYQSMY